jgi:hypothetical protein
MDAAQNPAPTAKRIVTVKHTSCPTCFLNGCNNVYQKTATSSHVKHSTSDTATYEGCSEKHEASFPYTDAGATCEDTIDGPLNNIGENYFVQNDVDATTVGTYTITYRAKNSVGTWNDEACRGLSVKYVRTVEVLDTLKPVIRLKYIAEKPIAGLAQDKKCDTVVGGAIHYEKYKASGSWGPALSKSDLSQDDCIAACEANNQCAGWTWRKADPEHVNFERCWLLNGAHVGYAPVNLHDLDYKERFNSGRCAVEVARSATADTGVNHEANPAYTSGMAQQKRGTFGPFMAEEQSSSTDAWLLAAAASAVTGLALLGISNRATPVAVPV